VRNKVKVAPKGPVAKGTCRHYWIVESPSGPTSRGVCKLCNVEKEFENYGPDLWRQDDISMLFEFPRLPDIEPDREWDDS
jgi:hypothetical protein